MRQQLIDATHLRAEVSFLFGCFNSIQTEARVHELESALSANLIKRREEIGAELSQISVERSEEEREVCNLIVIVHIHSENLAS